MDSMLVKTVPARAFGALSVSLAELLALVIQNIVFAWDEEHLFACALQDLVHIVELLRLRQVADISGVQQELRLYRQRLDLVDGGLQRPGDIRVCSFVEPHVTVADLDESQFTWCGCGIWYPVQSVRFQHTALHDAQ